MLDFDTVHPSLTDSSIFQTYATIRSRLLLKFWPNSHDIQWLSRLHVAPRSLAVLRR